MKETVYAFKMILKAALMLLCETNTEAVYINKGISRWSKNSIWRGYWLFCSRWAKAQSETYMKLADKIN